MAKTRLLFSKTGRAKLISHLDLMRTMRRAFLRAGVELKYSEGFNPHPYISAALPLSVGCGSICELIDFEPLGTLPEELPRILSDKLPEGITVLQAYMPVRKFSDIAWCEIRGRLFFDNGFCNGAAAELERRFSRAEQLIIQKKTKRGVTELDTMPHITGVGFHEAGEGEIVVSARLTAQNPVLNHNDLLNALNNIFDERPDFVSFRRIELYDMGHNVFR